MADLNEEQLIKKQNILESGLDIPEETIDSLVTAEDTQLASAVIYIEFVPVQLSLIALSAEP